MAPWTAVPALVALTSDPARDVGALALQLLKRQAERQADFVSNYLGAGLLAMHDFQQRLWRASHPGTSTPLGVSPSFDLITTETRAVGQLRGSLRHKCAVLSRLMRHSFLNSPLRSLPSYLLLQQAANNEPGLW